MLHCNQTETFTMIMKITVTPEMRKHWHMESGHHHGVLQTSVASLLVLLLLLLLLQVAAPLACPDSPDDSKAKACPQWPTGMLQTNKFHGL